MINMKRGQIEHLRMDFYFSGRPWYARKKGKIVGWLPSDSGRPRDLDDLPKLGEGFIAAFAAIGATVMFSRVVGEGPKICEHCHREFQAKRSTARYCEKCRSSYDRRNADPKYAEKNRERARKGMLQLRSGGDTHYKLGRKRK